MRSMMDELKELLKNEGGAQVFTKYAVTVGDNLYTQLYSNIDNTKYSLSNVLVEGEQLFAVLQDRSNSKFSRVNFSLNNADEIVKKLSDKKIYVSTKTACSSKNAPSKSVLAVTKDLNLAKNSIRVSLSHLTTKEEIDIFLKELTEVINENN